MITLDFPSLLSSANLRAFLRVIRAGESWNSHTDTEHDEKAFRVRYHPKVFPTLFDSFDQHPRIFEPLPDGSNRRSSAAGAFQITATTWDDMQSRYAGFGPTFTPWDQMACAVALIHTQGALDDVIDGRLDVALAKCGPRWASLPSSPLQDGGRKMSYARARQVYLDWGGALERADAVQEPAPIEDRSTQARPEDVERINAEEKPMAPTLIMGLLASLAEIFSPLLRAKLTKVLDKQTGDAAISGQVADRVIDFARQAAAQALPGMAPPPPATPGTPAPAAPSAASIDPVVAVGMVKANPALAAQVEAQVADYLEQIAPALDRIERLEAAAWEASESSMDRAAARVRDDLHDTTQPLLYGGIAFVGVLLLFVCGVIAMQVGRGETVGSEMWAALTGLIGWATAQVSVIYAYRFGSSRSSGAKDVVISELASKRRA
jgi:muramidase (phage lysozyme)